MGLSYVYTILYVYIYTQTLQHIHTDIHIHTNMHMHMHNAKAHTHTHTHFLYKYMRINIHIHIHMHMHTHTNTHIHTYIHTVYMYMYIYIHANKHRHTYTRTYTHTQTASQPDRRTDGQTYILSYVLTENSSPSQSLPWVNILQGMQHDSDAEHCSTRRPVISVNVNPQTLNPKTVSSSRFLCHEDYDKDLNMNESPLKEPDESEVDNPALEGRGT